MFDANWVAQQFPEFNSITVLGRGGQKSVFLVTHPIHGRVVLKLIRDQDPERVRREILAVNRVNSPRVPQILHEATIDVLGSPVIWLLEQWIDGDTVRTAIQSGPLTLPSLLRLGCHTLEALAAGEEVRIVHRDVKPDNLIQDRSGGYWLLDYGLARHLDLVSQTPTGFGGCGTPGYAPPEQYRNIKPDIDSRSDLFALGVTLYECATRANPYRDGATNVTEVIRRIEQTVPAVPVIAGAKGRDLADLILTMMQRRRDHRPASAAEALAWMRSLLA